MEYYHRGPEYFAAIELDGVTFSFTMPLGKHTPGSMVLSMYNDIYLDLQKVLVGIAKVYMRRDVDNKVQVSLNIDRPYTVHQVMGLVGECFRYCHEIEIPLCLYMLKAEITERIKQIMDATGALTFIKISNKVTVFVCGKEESCLTARMKIFQMIEEMLGRSTKIVDISMPVYGIIEQKARVFSRSRINSSEVLVSQEKLGITLEDVPFVTEKLVFDTQKLFYLLLYKKAEIEDILSDTQSYMATEEQCYNYTEVILKGFDMHEVRKAKDRMNSMYNTIMKMVAGSISQMPHSNVIIFEFRSKKRFLAIGEKAVLVKMILGSETFVEAEMDIEAETVEFLCGKKNGKIARIMKDIHCVIAIHKKPEKARVYLNISGRSDVFKTALEMIEDEFPEELTFCIDERHHKRIIGYGGKNIQKIMKKHGVYIKFMSERERKKAGYKDNVVIKTPRKNIENLANMKNDVINLIGDPKEKAKGLESMMSFSDFYDFVYPRYKLLYNKAVVEDIEQPNAIPYYLKDDDHHEFMDSKSHLVFKLEKTNQWFIRTTKALSLEKVTTIHWIGGVGSMSTFSWLFGYNYRSLFNNNKSEETENLQDIYLTKLSL